MFPYGNASRGHTSSPFSQNRPPSLQHYRPQTAGGFHNQSQLPLNRTYGRLPNQNYNYQPQRNNLSHSKVSLSNSHASNLSNLMNEPDVFPEELVFLLRNEEKNINNLKEKIEKEKSRVENDFAVFRAEIDHILEDVKISIQAQLDLTYKAYITKYAELKGEVQELRLMRKQILMSNNNPYNGYQNQKQPLVSNKDLVDQIEKDAEAVRNFKVYGYLTELQKQKLEPIQEISSELIIVGSAQCPFYCHKELVGKLKTVKNHFGGFIKEVFDSIQEYVITPEHLVEKEKFEMENTRNVLRDLESQPTRMKPFDVHYPANSRLEDRTAKDLRASRDVRKGKKFNAVSSNEQGCLTKWCEEIRMNRLERVETDHNDCILCIHFVGDRYVVTGSKDTSLNVYTLDGRKIRTLRGHEAAICCLGTVKTQHSELLASGSDNGCGSVILWDSRNWQMVSRIQAHEAAVTSIVDLEDGKHIATGSYDKKINIISMARNQKLHTLSNRSSVTGMVMTSDKARLVTAGLDKSISIWTIIRKNGMVETVIQQKVIPCEQLVCQLQPSLLRPEVVFCAGRDGTLRVLNIVTGIIEKSFTVNANSLIELVAFERELNADSPILVSCSCKDSALVATKMESGLSSLIKVPGGLGIDYGCGIGPKVVLSEAKEGMVAILSQKKDRREFSLYEIQMK